MKARTLVALAHVSVASGLMSTGQIGLLLLNERSKVLRRLELEKFRRRGIGKEEARRRGLDQEIVALENEVQMINKTLERL